MKINKMSEEKIAPQWISAKKEDNGVTKVSIATSELKRLQAISLFNEDVIAQECDKIELCANNKQTYYYGDKWGSDVVSELKEFASAVGLGKDKIVGINIDQVNEVVASEKSSIIKTASVKTDDVKLSLVDSLKSVIGDPFRIDSRSSTEHMEKENWEKISKNVNMKDAPSMKSNAINSIRGGEKYDLNSDVKTPIGQNSLTNPNAIEKLAEDTTIDTGLRLRNERAERESAIKQSHTDWEDGKIKEMEHRDIVAKGKVFPTESMFAQSGIGIQKTLMDIGKLPDQTEGEKISSSNVDRKKSIQREVVTSKWEPEMEQKVRGISNTFGEELKKFLNKG